MQRLNGDFGVMVDVLEEDNQGHNFWWHNFWCDMQVAKQFSDKEFGKTVAGLLVQQVVESKFSGGVISVEIIDKLHSFVNDLNYQLSSRGYKQQFGTLVLALDTNNHGVSLLWADERPEPPANKEG